jgi:hypothetical protein
MVKTIILILVAMLYLVSWPVIHAVKMLESDSSLLIVQLALYRMDIALIR